MIDRWPLISPSRPIHTGLTEEPVQRGCPGRWLGVRTVFVCLAKTGSACLLLPCLVTSLFHNVRHRGATLLQPARPQRPGYFLRHPRGAPQGGAVPASVKRGLKRTGALLVLGIPSCQRARASLLPLAHQLAQLPEQSRASLTDAESWFNFGYQRVDAMNQEAEGSCQGGGVARLDSFYANPQQPAAPQLCPEL